MNLTDALLAAAREFDPETRRQPWTCVRHSDACPRLDRPSSREQHARLAETVGQIGVVMAPFENWVLTETEACRPITELDRPLDVGAERQATEASATAARAWLELNPHHNPEGEDPQ